MQRKNIVRVLVVFALLLAVLGATVAEADSPDLLNWSDNFDSYATGSQMHGQGGWKGWDNSPAAGALTSSVQARSAPNSVDILGASDLVHEYSGYTSGSWVYKAWQYVPSNSAGQTYFILLNTYNDSGSYNWSTQVCFDVTAGMVYDTTGATCTGTSSLPIVYNQWVEIRVEIDLTADTQMVYYNNQLLFQDTWTGHVSGSGALNIGAVDLFANGADTVFYDDISLMPPSPTAVTLSSLQAGVPGVPALPIAVLPVAAGMVAAALYAWRRKA